MEGVNGFLVRVCIDEYRTYDAAGRMYTETADGILFRSLAELLIRTDQLLEQSRSPQSFLRRRLFATKKTEIHTEKKEASPANKSDIFLQTGKYATYDVIIQSKMHAGWQGLIRTGDRTFLGLFESELELLRRLFEDLIKRESKTEEQK